MNKEQHRLDDLFREGLSNLEMSPSGTGRSRIIAKAMRIVRKHSLKPWLLTGILSLLILGFIAGILQVNRIPHSTEPKGNHKAIALAKNHEYKSEPNLANPEIQSYKQKINQPVRTDAPGNKTGKEITNSKGQKIKLNERINDHYRQSEIQNNIPASGKIMKSLSGKNNNDAYRNTEIQISSVSNPVQGKTADQKLYKDSLSSPTSSTQGIAEPSKSTIKQDSSRQANIQFPQGDTVINNGKSTVNKNWNIRAAIYYSPEWIFNALVVNHYVNNMGLEASFKFGPYSVRTGAGLSINNGYNDMVVEKRPYLGGYQSLDYITYQWDAKHYYLVPTIHTTWKDVYDTVIHYSYLNREKQYIYLQVPLILGYDFLRHRNFSMGIRFGPTMSVLLQSKDMTGNYDPGKDKLVVINDVAPERIHLNWQAMAGINAAFRVSGMLFIEIEPEFRYYFDSVFEKKGIADKPWSVGFRIAFLVDL